MNFNHFLTETNTDDTDVKSQIENQIQIQETKDSGWIFDKIDSMKIRFHKTSEIIGWNYVKRPLRSFALKNIKNDDKYSFYWSILAKLHLCGNDHPNRVLN